jgi:hypothetical protein
MDYIGTTGVSATLSMFAVMTKRVHATNRGFVSFLPVGASPNNRDWASQDGRAFEHGTAAGQVLAVSHTIFSGSNGFANPVLTQLTITLSAPFLLTFVQASGTATAKINATADVTDTYGGTPTAPSGLVIGCRFDTAYTQFAQNSYQELIYYGADQTASATGLRTDINAHYAIY